MRSRCLLLRVLLCLVLVANGTTAVFAGARMTLASGATTSHHDAAPPCHAMAGDAAMAMSSDHASPAPPASHDDCCDTSACLCSCVATATAIFAIDALTLAPLPAASPASAPVVSRTSPALQHPIRPPIG